MLAIDKYLQNKRFSINHLVQCTNISNQAFIYMHVYIRKYINK